MQFLGVPYTFPSYVPPVTAWLMHGPFAHWIVNASKPRRVVELGTHYGFSYFCFCEAIASHKIPADCFAVDTWRGDEHAGFYDEEVFESVEKENQKYSDFSKLLRKTFADALADIPDGTVDLLHVDGRHFYDDVKEDFESWVPKLSDRAIVLFHDTEVLERGFGIWKYWSEISNNKVAVNLPYQHGLGVLFWGERQLPELLRLIELLRSPTSAALVIDQFYSSGDAFVNNQNVRSQLNAKIDEAYHARNLLILDAKSLDAQVASLKSETETLSAEVVSLRKETELLSSELEALRLEVGVLRQRTTRLHDANEAKSRVIQELNIQLGTVRGLLHDARQRPMSQMVRLLAYRLLRIADFATSPLSESVKQKIGRLLEQLDPKRAE